MEKTVAGESGKMDLECVMSFVSVTGWEGEVGDGVSLVLRFPSKDTRGDVLLEYSSTGDAREGGTYRWSLLRLGRGAILEHVSTF